MIGEPKSEDKKPDEKDPLSTGAYDFVAEFKREESEREGNLEGLHFEQRKFSAEELARIIEIRKKLDYFTEQSRHGNEDNEWLNDAIAYLDSCSDWAFKFSTGELGNIKDTDSIYYVTKQGISLRLKRSLLEKGDSEHVIQPFMEVIVFKNPNDPSIQENVTIGAYVREYCSLDFEDLLKHNSEPKDFLSQVDRCYKDGHLYFVDTSKPGPRHIGHAVNKIF